MHVSVAYELLPKRSTARAAVVMDHFGIGIEQGRHVIAENLELPIERAISSCSPVLRDQVNRACYGPRRHNWTMCLT